MKIRILTWAFNLLLTMLDADIVETNYKNKLRLLIFKMYKDNLTPQMTDREIAAMVFDAKYTETIKELGYRSLSGVEPQPNKILSEYYLKANKGDVSFTRDSFYRHLSQAGDNEIRKLRYRIKRNQ
jgi:hypothetical protein